MPFSRAALLWFAGCWEGTDHPQLAGRAKDAQGVLECASPTVPLLPQLHNLNIQGQERPLITYFRPQLLSSWDIRDLRALFQKWTLEESEAKKDGIEMRLDLATNKQCLFSWLLMIFFAIKIWYLIVERYKMVSQWGKAKDWFVDSFFRTWQSIEHWDHFIMVL